MIVVVCCYLCLPIFDHRPSHFYSLSSMLFYNPLWNLIFVKYEWEDEKEREGDSSDYSVFGEKGMRDRRSEEGDKGKREMKHEVKERDRERAGETQHRLFFSLFLAHMNPKG